MAWVYSETGNPRKTRWHPIWVPELNRARCELADFTVTVTVTDVGCGLVATWDDYPI
jgi:hypothetical protein